MWRAAQSVRRCCTAHFHYLFYIIKNKITKQDLLFENKRLMPRFGWWCLTETGHLSAHCNSGRLTNGRTSNGPNSIELSEDYVNSLDRVISIADILKFHSTTNEMGGTSVWWRGYSIVFATEYRLCQILNQAHSWQMNYFLFFFEQKSWI